MGSWSVLTPSEKLLTGGVQQIFTAVASVDVTWASKRVSVIVGLGANPAVAEEVLASIRVASDEPSASAQMGHLTGRMLLTGGPATTKLAPVPGTVVIAQGSVTKTVTVGHSGNFSLALRPGVYEGQTAGADGAACTAAHPGAITANSTSSIVVPCAARVP
jgi:hypothetical protein